MHTLLDPLCLECAVALAFPFVGQVVVHMAFVALGSFYNTHVDRK